MRQLFYDLVFVAACIKLGTYLKSDMTYFGGFAFLSMFYSLWLCWLNFTLNTSRFFTNDSAHRVRVQPRRFPPNFSLWPLAPRRRLPRHQGMRSQQLTTRPFRVRMHVGVLHRRCGSCMWLPRC